MVLVEGRLRLAHQLQCSLPCMAWSHCQHAFVHALWLLDLLVLVLARRTLPSGLRRGQMPLDTQRIVKGVLLGRFRER